MTAWTPDEIATQKARAELAAMVDAATFRSLLEEVEMLNAKVEDLEAKNKWLKSDNRELRIALSLPE